LIEDTFFWANTSAAMVGSTFHTTGKKELVGFKNITLLDADFRPRGLQDIKMVAESDSRGGFVTVPSQCVPFYLPTQQAWIVHMKEKTHLERCAPLRTLYPNPTLHPSITPLPRVQEATSPQARHAPQHSTL
jgi:hypothetical protein